MESLAKVAKLSATILAIGTANPVTCYYQKDYPDFLFKITKSEHKTELKDKFKRICEKSMVKKRYLGITEEILKANPNICTYKAPSFDARQDLMIHAVPKLGKEAVLKAIKEWGHPISSLTHLIFCTNSCIDTPGADFQLVKLLGLDPSINRIMIYGQGCFAGGKVLRLAKDVAENNAGARVLIVCSESATVLFHQPCDSHLDVLVGQALFGDGAAAVIVGANPDPKSECQLFSLMSARETIIPNSEHAVVGHWREMGMQYYLSSENPQLIGGKMEECLSKVFEGNNGVNIGDWNSLFYSLHPGGPGILDRVEQKLGLKEGKLRASRHVLSEFGNMGAPSVLFILDEMRKKSLEQGKATTGEGFEWGVLVGIGPGLTVETVVLRSAPTTAI